MPFIVRILADDLEHWELYEHQVHRGEAYHEEHERAGRFHYRLKHVPYRAEYDHLKLSAHARLDTLVNQDTFCRINVERGYLSDTLGSGKRTHILLEALNRELDESRPLVRRRLAIEAIDTTTQPPRVFLKEWKNDEGRV